MHMIRVYGNNFHGFVLYAKGPSKPLRCVTLCYHTAIMPHVNMCCVMSASTPETKPGLFCLMHHTTPQYIVIYYHAQWCAAIQVHCLSALGCHSERMILRSRMPYQSAKVVSQPTGIKIFHPNSVP